jgi:large subunit ribosomal protein L17
MRHRKTTPQLGRSPSHRKAMLRNMVTDFLRYGKVRTTEAKAKALRPYAEKLITAAKKDTLHARRRVARVIRDKEVLRKLFNEIAPRYAERPGGYTRIVKLPSRAGDNAAMALIELVEAEMKTRPKRKKRSYDGPLTAAADTAVAAAAAEEAAPAEDVADSEEVVDDADASAEASDDAGVDAETEDEAPTAEADAADAESAEAADAADADAEDEKSE